MRRLLSASLAVVLLSASAPAYAFRAPRAATLPVQTEGAKTPVSYSVEVIDVAALMKKHKIVQPLTDLKAVTSDAKGEHVAFVFVDKNGVASVYKDAKLMMQAIIQIEPDTGVFPLVFRFTSDGRLLHAVNPYDLFVDSKRLTTARNAFSYYVGAESVASNGGLITFAETNSIREYRPASGKVTVRYEHPHERIVMLRRRNKDIVYTATDEDGVSRIYRNGKLLSDEPVDNPANFLLMKDGSVAFFTADDGGFSVIRDGKTAFRGDGLSAFLFEDPKGGLWTVGYTVTKDDLLDVSVFRGDERLAANLGNMEGYVTFLNQRSYAFRGSPFGDGDNTFFLYKDGKKTGQGFSFEGKRDATGVKYAENGRTYMRNLVDGHWAVFEDGKRILPAKIRDAWYVNIAGRTVQVFATTR